MAQNNETRRTPPVLHAELRTFLKRHRESTPAHRRTTHDALVPILRTVNAATAHVNELLMQLEEAELAAHDTGLDHNMTWLHEQAAVVKHRGEMARAALRDFAKVYGEFEKLLTRPEAAILRDCGIELPAEPTA